MANIDHTAKLKAIKKQLYYLENREAILAKAKARRTASQTTTETVTVTKVNGQYSLTLGDLKLVVTPDAQVSVTKITKAPAVELKSNGEPYKTTARQREAVRKCQAERQKRFGSVFPKSSLDELNSMVRSISK
jgi:hypothetical protein